MRTAVRLFAFGLLLAPFAAEAADPGLTASLSVGGTSMQGLSAVDTTAVYLNMDAKNGYVVSGALGYQLPGPFRLAFNLDYGHNDLSGYFSQNVFTLVPCGASTPCLDQNANGDVSTLSGFGMAYVDLPVSMVLTPYVGLGVGFVNTDFDVGTRATLNSGTASRFDILKSTDTVLGYRGAVGLSYDLGAIDLTADYSYTMTQRVGIAGKGTLTSFTFDPRIKVHTLRAGVTYSF